MIARLVNDHGWRVGVVAQSHSVVENLLDEVVAGGSRSGRVGKKAKEIGRCVHAWQPVEERDYPDFVAEHDGCVIGGTAWDFANPGRVYPAVLTCWSSRRPASSAWPTPSPSRRRRENLLLLGDPQQLPQVSQGTHFEPVDGSALGWLVGDAPTLDPSLGYFLARSWRMHSAVCGPVSRHSYGGRLTSETDVTDARRLAGREPGVHELAVDHDGNSTDSVEEAERIVAEIGALLGSEWTDEKGTRPLGQGDVLVVAAYNAQVRMIRRHLEDAGLRDVLVGTVDKFQGQAGPGGVLLDGGILDRRRTTRNLFPAQPQPGQRRGQPGEIRGVHRPVTAADRLSALGSGGSC